MSRLLLIEDEDVIRRALSRFLARRGFDVHAVATIGEACDARGPGLHSFDVTLADLRLPDEPGTAIIARVAPCPVVIMTSHASVRSAVDVMKSGASDYIAKPFDHDELLLVLERAMHRDRLAARAAALAHDLERLLPPSLRVAGTSLEAVAERLHAQADHRAADRGLARRCWLWGKTGSGREAVARALHARAPQSDGPLVVEDLAAGGAVPDDSGDEPVASDPPTDPQDVARLRAARNGTLVLRHLHLLSLQAQRSLARRLGQQTGSSTALIVIADAPPDARPIASELAQLFHPEGCARIAPLDERRADIVTHARHVLESIRVRTGREPPTLSDCAADWLSARAWPGQVLELEQLVARSALVVDTGTIAREHLTGLDTTFDAAPDLEGYFRWFVVNHEQQLSETGLAQRLGISRKALWERRQRAGLPRAAGDSGRTPS